MLVLADLIFHIEASHRQFGYDTETLVAAQKILTVLFLLPFKIYYILCVIRTNIKFIVLRVNGIQLMEKCNRRQE
jgi:hypothetical protein